MCRVCACAIVSQTLLDNLNPNESARRSDSYRGFGSSLSRVVDGIGRALDRKISSVMRRLGVGPDGTFRRVEEELNRIVEDVHGNGRLRELLRKLVSYIQYGSGLLFD